MTPNQGKTLDIKTICIHVLINTFARICLYLSEDSFESEFLQLVLSTEDDVMLVLLALFQLFFVRIIGRSGSEYHLFEKVRESMIAHIENKRLANVE